MTMLPFRHRTPGHGINPLNPCINRYLAAILLVCAGCPLPAQELSLLGGTMRTADSKYSSYSWQLDYRQDFYKNLAASVAYINEGHVPGHHRDGTAFQAWSRLPFSRDRFAVALGLGAYYYYDTQLLPTGATGNIHGTAPIFSASATGYLQNRWHVWALFNHISPAHEMKVNTVVLGVGYWFGREEKPMPGKLGHGPDEKVAVSEAEFTVFAGQSVVNTFFSPAARAYAMEYRHGFTPHIDWTASLIYEGNPQIVRRSGFATQAWAVNTFFDERFTVGIGFGPYFYIDQKHPEPASASSPAKITPLASITLSQRLSDHWIARLNFHRVTSSYNRDADIFLLGLGYRWPR